MNREVASRPESPLALGQGPQHGAARLRNAPSRAPR